MIKSHIKIYLITTVESPELLTFDTKMFFLQSEKKLWKVNSHFKLKRI